MRSSELAANRTFITAVASDIDTTLHPVPYARLQSVAQGYRQREVLYALCRGEWVQNPAWWQNNRKRRPRRNELRSWQHLRERIVAEGYALEVVMPLGGEAGDELYRLMTITEYQP